MANTEKSALEHLAGAKKVLIGIGGEWRADKHSEIRQAYEALAQLLRDKDYFIVTTNTDAVIYDSSLEDGRIRSEERRVGKEC